MKVVLYTGSVGYGGSQYGKQNKTIHIANVACTGNEDKLSQCTFDTISLSQGKNMLRTSNVAGVKCYTPNQCIPPPSTGGAQCSPGSIRLTGSQASAADGNIEYCYHGTWSPFCTLGPVEATVACRQLGFTSYDSMSAFVSINNCFSFSYSCVH